MNPNLKIKVDTAGICFRRALIELQGDQSIAWLRETPSAFKNSQSNINLRLNRGDVVDVISADGLTLSEGHRVVHSLAGSVTLSAPLRLVTLEESGLFENDQWQVVPEGLSYAIRNKRSNAVEPKLHSTAEAARNEILRRVPA